MTPEEKKKLIRELENYGPELVALFLRDREALEWRSAERQNIIRAWLAEKDRDYLNLRSQTPITISKWALTFSMLSLAAAFAALFVSVYRG